MAIFITNLALRRAPIAITTARTQCRGLQIRRPASVKKIKPPVSAKDKAMFLDKARKSREKMPQKRGVLTKDDHHDNPSISPLQLQIRRPVSAKSTIPSLETSRSMAVTMMLERRQSVSNGDHNDHPSTLASGPRIHKVQTLQVRRQVSAKPKAPYLKVARASAAAGLLQSNPVVANGDHHDNPSTSAFEPQNRKVQNDKHRVEMNEKNGNTQEPMRSAPENIKFLAISSVERKLGLVNYKIEVQRHVHRPTGPLILRMPSKKTVSGGTKNEEENLSLAITTARTQSRGLRIRKLKSLRSKTQLLKSAALEASAEIPAYELRLSPTANKREGMKLGVKWALTKSRPNLRAEEAFVSYSWKTEDTTVEIVGDGPLGDIASGSFFLGTKPASYTHKDTSPHGTGTGSIHDLPSTTAQDGPSSFDRPDTMMTPMFSPTSPRQAKASTRRHLTHHILNELLGEPSASPVKSAIPPLNLTPESVGLPPDVSWRPLADKDHKSFLHSDHAPNGASSSEPLLSRLRDTATVLVLSCASRTLALSDFIRLSPQGEHIEGWTSGIVRVIPGRNPTTLERSNHYFLVFSTAAAAAGYAENIDRIHKMSQKWTPERPQHSGLPAPGVEMGKLEEDVGALVRSFTLLPNTQPRVYMRRLQKPYRPAIARVIETGAYHNVLAQEKDRPGENLVLFQLDEGLMNGSDLMKVIEADGRRRNLTWRLEGNPEGDIMQFGGGGKNDASRSDNDWEDVEGKDRDNDKRERRKRKSALNMGLYPRHIVRFRDATEAKRFVRAWHCRTMEGEPWDKLAANGHWAGGKVSAEILW